MITIPRSEYSDDKLPARFVGVRTTDTEVIVYETAEEVPPPNIQPPPEPDPVLDADGHVFRRRLLRVLAQKFGMTVSDLKGALGRDA